MEQRFRKVVVKCAVLLALAGTPAARTAEGDTVTPSYQWQADGLAICETTSSWCYRR